MSEKENKLVRLEDLFSEDLQKLAPKQNALNILLNQPPKKEWIEEVPYTDGALHIPIGKVEFLLTAIFQDWKVEIKEWNVIANSICMAIKLHYQSPITGKMEWTDGAGAAVINTASGTPPTDFSQVLTSSVVQAFPRAKSEAVKNAAKSLGKLFGKDLNRKKGSDYSSLQGRFDNVETIQLKKELSKAFAENQDVEQTETLKELVIQKEQSKEADVDFYRNIIKDLKGQTK